MAEWDTDALVEDVKERGSLPANDARFTTAKILASATLELREGVAPLLSASRAEYLVYTYTQSVTSGQAAYRMPSRAVGGTLRNVSWLDSASNPKRLRELSQDEIETIGATTTGGTPFGYYVRNYHVVLAPVPNVAGSLEMPYYARPNKLVLHGDSSVSGARAVALTNVGGDFTNGTFITLYTNPPAVLIAATSMDIVRATPGFETVASSTSILTENLGGGVYRFTLSGLPTAAEEPGALASIVVGDYLCIAGEAPVPQAPVELHGLLAARTARRLVKAVGDDRFAMLSEDVAELEQKARDWLTQRVAGQTQQAGGSVGSGGLGPFGGAFWQW